MTKLPETANMDLPQDFQDGADLALDNEEEEEEDKMEHENGAVVGNGVALGNGVVKV